MPYKDPEVRKKYLAKYYQDHKEYCDKQKLEWARDHRESTRASYKKHYEANKEKIIAKTAEYAKEHPDIKIKSVRKWQKNNPEKVLAIFKRREMRKRNVEINDLTIEQWEEIKIQFNYLCAYCGRSGFKLTMDHISPISRGGNHTVNNLVPACRSCNASKGSKDLLHFLYHRL